MARTKAADYEDKRQRITENAAALFAREGFAAASIASLAEACDVSKSLIYHYYPSKEAILFDVMNTHMDELLSAIPECDPATDMDTSAAFRRFSRDLLRRYAGAADKQKVLLYELGALPDAERREIVQKQRRLIDYAESLLRQLPGNQQARELGAKVMLYFGMLNWTHTWLRPRGAISRDDVADLASELVMGEAP